MSQFEDKAEELLGLLYDSQNPIVQAVSLVSGTAYQDTTKRKSNVLVHIGGASAGTVTVAIGPTNAVANTIVNAMPAATDQLLNIELPAGWFIMVTVATATIAGATQVA